MMNMNMLSCNAIKERHFTFVNIIYCECKCLQNMTNIKFQYKRLHVVLYKWAEIHQAITSQVCLIAEWIYWKLAKDSILLKMANLNPGSVLS